MTDVSGRGAPLNPETYLEVSPEPCDGREKVGRRPRSIARADLLALNSFGTPTSPIKALRARCLHCCGFEVAEVRKCVDYTCPSWPYRMGHNPFIKTAKTGGAPEEG